MYCQKCGTQAEGKFCPKCGNQMIADPKPQTEPALKKKGKGFLVVFIVTVVLFVVLAFIPDINIGSVIIWLLVLLFIEFCIFMAVNTGKWKKEAQTTRAEEIAERGATAFAAFKHTAGLPIPENMLCQLYITPARLEILANGQQFNLSADKIIDATTKTDVEIQQHVVSSAGGAIGGAILFGAVGALIGGRAKTKETRQFHTYLIITYQKDETTQYMGFDVSYASSQAQQFVNAYHRNGRPLFQSES